MILFLINYTSICQFYIVLLFNFALPYLQSVWVRPKEAQENVCSQHPLLIKAKTTRLCRHSLLHLLLLSTLFATSTCCVDKHLLYFLPLFASPPSGLTNKGPCTPQGRRAPGGASSDTFLLQVFILRCKGGMVLINTTSIENRGLVSSNLAMLFNIVSSQSNQKGHGNNDIKFPF